MKHIQETLVWLDKRASQCEAAAKELRGQMEKATMKGASLRRAFEALKETCPEIEDPEEVPEPPPPKVEIKAHTTVALADQRGKIRGVRKKGKKWMGTAYYEKRSHYLGMFDTKKEAAFNVKFEEEKAAKGTVKPTIPLKGSGRLTTAVIPAGPRPCTWECNKCGRGRKSETGERPDTCEKCGEDHGFTRLR